MVKIAKFSLLACVVSTLFASGCKKEDVEAGNPPVHENIQPIPVSEEQRKRDSILEQFNANLKNLEEQIQAANARISKMGKKKNWSWRNKVEVVEAKKKKIVGEAIDLEKKPDRQSATQLSILVSSLESLSRDMDKITKKMR